MYFRKKVQKDLRNEENQTCDIDVLKGIAIIGIITYYMGILKTGHVGVELFFLINGFLIVPSLIKEIDEGIFRYLQFLRKRMSRLLPVLIMSCALCFLLGYFAMLPNDFENLCKSLIATCVFSNNILAAITTKNYWDVINGYKPLVHTRYLGY